EDPLFSPEKCWREMADLGDERGRFAETSNHELHRRLPAPCVSPGRGNCLHCGGPASYLAVSKTDGSQMHRITFGPGNFWLETVLRDGRVLASASSHSEATEAARKTRLLYTLRPD